VAPKSSHERKRKERRKKRREKKYNMKNTQTSQRERERERERERTNTSSCSQIIPSRILETTQSGSRGGVNSGYLIFTPSNIPVVTNPNSMEM
jgi:hypothetical protein